MVSVGRPDQHVAADRTQVVAGSQPGQHRRVGGRGRLSARGDENRSRVLVDDLQAGQIGVDGQCVTVGERHARGGVVERERERGRDGGAGRDEHAWLVRRAERRDVDERWRERDGAEPLKRCDHPHHGVETGDVGAIGGHLIDGPQHRRELGEAVVQRSVGRLGGDRGRAVDRQRHKTPGSPHSALVPVAVAVTSTVTWPRPRLDHGTVTVWAKVESLSARQLEEHPAGHRRGQHRGTVGGPARQARRADQPERERLCVGPQLYLRQAEGRRWPPPRRWHSVSRSRVGRCSVVLRRGRGGPGCALRSPRSPGRACRCRESVPRSATGAGWGLR